MHSIMVELRATTEAELVGLLATLLRAEILADSSAFDAYALWYYQTFCVKDQTEDGKYRVIFGAGDE
jgi:hypothetical protein